MHIPDGFLNMGVSVTTTAVSAGVIGYGLYRARKDLDEKTVPLMALCAAFVFAAQMLNFPVAGGTSGHFLGGVLVAVLLGPWLGSLVIALVLLVQMTGFADGGFTAYGANVFNMALVGTIVGYFLFYGIKTLLPKNRACFLASIAVASWLSVVLASTACAFELAISGTSPLSAILPAMVGVHSLIGIGEAIVTTAVVSVVLAVRPDLVKAYGISQNALAGTEVVGVSN